MTGAKLSLIRPLPALLAPYLLTPRATLDPGFFHPKIVNHAGLKTT